MKVEWGHVRLCLTVSWTNKIFNPEDPFGLATSNASLSIANKILGKNSLGFATSWYMHFRESASI